MNTNSLPPSGSTFRPPLRVAPDISANWTNLEADFDTAGAHILAAHRADGEATDLPIMNLSTWGMVPVGDRLALAPLAKHHAPKVLRASAFSNLMTKVGAPADFVRDRLPALLQLTVSNWMLASMEKNASALLRLRGDEVQAVVSDRYCPLDQEELLSCVREALVRHCALDEVEVKAVGTGLVDVVRLVFPAEQHAIKVGDVSALGIDISSSSFGRSALHVRGLVWRLKCLNGLRVEERTGSFSARHVGDVSRIRETLAESIPSALMVARGTMARWKAAIDVSVQDVAALIDGMRELSHGELKLVREHVQREVGADELPERAPLYDVLNGVTSAAQALSPARRLEVESMAGQLLVRHTGGAS